MIIMELLFFTKTNSHHTVQIFKSFIFEQLLFIFVFRRKIMQLQFNDFYCAFTRNFVQKNIYFEWMRKPGFAKKSHFVQKRATVAHENLLFSGNQTHAWCPLPEKGLRAKVQGYPQRMRMKRNRKLSKINKVVHLRYINLLAYWMIWQRKEQVYTYSKSWI